MCLFLLLFIVTINNDFVFLCSHDWEYTEAMIKLFLSECNQRMRYVDRRQIKISVYLFIFLTKKKKIELSEKEEKKCLLCDVLIFQADQLL